MPITRDLIPKLDNKDQSLTGFQCSDCDWEVLLRCDSQAESPSIQSVVNGFKNHNCAEYSRSEAA